MYHAIIILSKTTIKKCFYRINAEGFHMLLTHPYPRRQGRVMILKNQITFVVQSKSKFFMLKYLISGYGHELKNTALIQVNDMRHPFSMHKNSEGEE